MYIQTFTPPSSMQNRNNYTTILLSLSLHLH